MAELTEEARQRALDVLYCSATPIGSMPLGKLAPVPSRRPLVAHPPACVPPVPGDRRQGTEAQHHTPCEHQTPHILSPVTSCQTRMGPN